MAPNNSTTEFVDVKALIQELSMDELLHKANIYFEDHPSKDYLLSKPFADIYETPDLLIRFAYLLKGLQICPGMTVLDFGAGPCWVSRYLTQLGCHAIALDISPAALQLGQDMLAKHPVIGNQPTPQFLLFDGYHINLPDKSVDRISCFDAFHHVPNPEQVLRELFRVLKDDGIAGFSEPGPNHSKAPQSQYEMRTYRTIENDINIQEIWSAAQKIGFNSVELSVFNPNSFRLSLEDFEKFLKGQESNNYLEQTRSFLQENRMFFLFKGDPNSVDSRQRLALVANLQVNCFNRQVSASVPLEMQVVVTNTSRATWLPSSTQLGGVLLGAHLLDESGSTLNHDYLRYPLTTEPERLIQPGETVAFKMQVSTPPPGKYTLEFDLVSERVTWFGSNSSQTVRIDIEVT